MICIFVLSLSFSSNECHLIVCAKLPGVYSAQVEQGGKKQSHKSWKSLGMTGVSGGIGGQTPWLQIQLVGSQIGGSPPLLDANPTAKICNSTAAALFLLLLHNKNLGHWSDHLPLAY